MGDLTEELKEELEAFNPRWQHVYPSMGAAAEAAGIIELYKRWTQTADGRAYLDTVCNLPDRTGDAKREAEQSSLPRSLPYGYRKNLGFALTHTPDWMER